MRIAAFITLLLTTLALADHSPAQPKRAAILLEGLGNVTHPVSTKHPEAQKFFDQGLRLLYAFNHDEAHRSFARAAELDPKLAMAHWGMALAVGPNYNLDAEEEALKAAYASIQKARQLSEHATEVERRYIAALATRYAADPKSADKANLARAYHQAMGALSKQYPDDLDAATLYAEGAMNLRPWKLWDRMGKPAEGTREILDVLEAVLRRDPEHTGANHYYIHAIEASPWPERGLAAAARLDVLAPGAGHLVHMPAHIHARVGDHAAAARANARAAEVDLAYIQRFKVTGVYPLMYYSHNLHFLAVSQAMQGRRAEAQKAADQLAAHIAPHVAEMPMLEFFLPTPLLVQVRFQRWDDLLAAPAPNEKLLIVRSIRHFGRGLALVARGNDAAAQRELDALRELHRVLPADLKHGDQNLAKDVLAIPRDVLEARLLLHRKDHAAAVALLEKAIAAEDNLNYIEPADWWMPVRETLGHAHLRANEPAQAEKVFRADLARNPRNPRSLFGLAKTLEAQGKTHDAGFVRREFERAWRKGEGAPTD